MFCFEPHGANVFGNLWKQASYINADRWEEAGQLKPPQAQSSTLDPRVYSVFKAHAAF